MKYCNNCILPDTRPNLEIMDDGRCNACHSWNNKLEKIDWNKREKHFFELVKQVKQKSQAWDCVIPVSGGKDSTWQVIKALQYDLKPLCITWKTPARSDLGQQNLDNLVSLGVDHLDFTINPIIEKKFTLEALEKYGSVAIPMHMALFAIPLQIAVKFKIPLVLWGENSGIEYGGSVQETLGVNMNRNWLLTYGVTHRTVAENWVTKEMTIKDLSAYVWPTDEELQTAGVNASFLGWYFMWDAINTYNIAKQHGFKALDLPKIGYYNFADVDDEFIIVIHHWIKWYKFGITRLWDNLSLEIRNKRITRDAAIKIVKNVGYEYPKDSIEKFCCWSGITVDRFLNMVEKFRNNDIWFYQNNCWQIKDFLVKDWRWA